MLGGMAKGKKALQHVLEGLLDCLADWLLVNLLVESR